VRAAGVSLYWSTPSCNYNFVHGTDPWDRALPRNAQAWPSFVWWSSGSAFVDWPSALDSEWPLAPCGTSTLSNVSSVEWMTSPAAVDM